MSWIEIFIILLVIGMLSIMIYRLFTMGDEIDQILGNISKKYAETKGKVSSS